MSARYMQHSRQPPSQSELPALQQDLRKALNEYLTLLQDYIDSQNGQHSPSMYTGVSGIALLYLYLIYLIPDSPDFADTLLQQQISSHTLRVPNTLTRISFLETQVGLATIDICRSLGGCQTKSARIKDTLGSSLKLINTVVQSLISTQVQDDDGCEVLYGSAGLLYALLQIRAVVPENSEETSTLVSDETIKSVISVIIEKGRLGAKLYANDCPVSSKPGLMWRWHGKRYLGACHGVAGILHMLLLCPRHLVDPYMPEILTTTTFLLDLQEAGGNFPSKAPETPSHDKVSDLVQWCHGASGILICLCTLLKAAADAVDSGLQERIKVALVKGATLVYERGFLTKGLGLCHGVAGSVYSLLAVHDALGKDEYLMQAAHLSHLASIHATELINTPDRPWSLYEGVAGMCAAWGTIILRLQGDKNKSLGMPGFDDLVSGSTGGQKA